MLCLCCAVLRAPSKALHHDPYNVKAMYRQAVAQHQQGTTGGLEAAVRTLQAAQRLEPSNLEVRAVPHGRGRWGAVLLAVGVCVAARGVLMAWCCGAAVR